MEIKIDFFTSYFKYEDLLELCKLGENHKISAQYL